MGDCGAGARRAHDLDVGRLGVAARQRVDRRSRALRVALHELVDALGDEQVGERVDGVVERAQLGVDRLALRAGERGQPGGGVPNGIVVSSQRAGGDARRASGGAGPSPSATLLARRASDTRGSRARSSSSRARAAATAASAASTSAS